MALRWQLIASFSAAGATMISAVFIAFQSYHTRLLVKTTTQASLDGNIQLSVVPRGGTGALNLRVENVGAGTADKVKVLFPCGLKGILKGGIEEIIAEGGSLELGSMAPREKREWSLVLPDKVGLDQLPRFVDYDVSFEVPRASRLPFVRKLHGMHVSRAGSIDMHSYSETVIRAYVGLEDIVRCLEEIKKVLGEGPL